MFHKLIIEKQFADAIYFGSKSFVVRKNDRGYNKGDIIMFNVMDDYHYNIDHPIMQEVYEVTYVLSGWGLLPGYVVLNLKKVGADYESIQK